jgi:hypothetical protein
MKTLIAFLVVVVAAFALVATASERSHEPIAVPSDAILAS